MKKRQKKGQKVKTKSIETINFIDKEAQQEYQEMGKN